MIILMYAYFIVLSIFTSSIFGQQHQPDPMDLSVGTDSDPVINFAQVGFH